MKRSDPSSHHHRSPHSFRSSPFRRFICVLAPLTIAKALLACGTFTQGGNGPASVESEAAATTDGSSGVDTASSVDEPGSGEGEDATPAYVASPCRGADGGPLAATAHWLCDDFDRDGTSPALPPLWTSVQQVSGGFVVLDSKRSRSLPKALLIQTSAQNSVGELHSDRTSSGVSSYSAMRCRFDVFIESAGTSSGSGGKARIVNLKLRRGFADFVVVELKVNDGSTILEHGGLISRDAGVSIVPAVTFGTLSAMRWHQLTVTAQGTGYSVNLDGIETTVTLVGGSNAPFDGADLTFGLAALSASGPWAAVMDNVVCDALP